MTDADPERHLVRAASAPLRQLGRLAGLDRLSLEEHRLPSGGQVTLEGGTGAEGFVYVLAGAGELSTAAETLSIAAGDFVALAPGESPRLENPQAEPLQVLAGFSDRAEHEN